MKYKIFLAIFVIALISSVIITTNGTTGVCKTGAGCELVNNSQYGSFLGIKNSVYGIIIFSLMIILTLFHMNNPTKHSRFLIHWGIILGAIISLYFLYLQFFVIRIFCEFCIVVDLGMIIALMFLFWLWKH